MSFLSKFLVGFSAPVQGGKLILRSGPLLRYSIAPVLITCVVFSFGLSWAFPLISAYLIALLPAAVGFWMTLVYWIGLGLAYAFSFTFVMVGLVLIANLVAIPFQSLLAERALMELGVIENQKFALRRWISTTIRMTGVSLIRMVVFVIIGIFLFILALLPGVQVISGFLGLVIVASDCCDYSLELLEFSFRRRMSFLKKHFWELSGFGCCFGVTFLIPLLNFLLLPVAVVGGAWLMSQLKLVALNES